MNRQIKFRVWDKRNKKWATDFTLDLDGNLLCDDGRTIFIRNDFVLMQFTGLHDKNGKEIWEGDVIKYEDYRGIIRFGLDGGWQIPGFYIEAERVEEGSERYDIYRHDKNYKLITFFPYHVEVIGNIYENSEIFGDEQC